MFCSSASRRAAGATVLLFVCATWISAPIPGQDGGEPLEKAFADSALVRRIEWPVRFVPRRPGGCRDIRPDQVQVWEDGAEIVPDTVQRTPLETIHVILMDASGSMTSRLDRARTAALQYVSRLPAEDRVMVASFNHNMVLHTPVTRDRDRVRQALEGVETGDYTAFNDALYYVIRYLSSRPERKVMILLTDGCDTASLSVHPFDEVIELAEQTDNLTVFPIGVDLPTSCQPLMVSIGGSRGPTLLLDRLAYRSGGQLFRTGESTEFSRIFRTIKRRVEQEGFLTYRPIPFGQGPKDRPELQNYRKRRVRVRSMAREVCRIESAGPQSRVESTDPDRLLGRLDLKDPLRPEFGRRLVFEDWWTEPGGDSDSHLLLEEDRIRGRAADILTERSKLYARVPYSELGAYRSLRNSVERLGLRDFELSVPPFDLLRARLTSPESLMLYLLENDSGPFSRPADPRSRKDRARRELRPAWIHGQTLLELREVFAQGLFAYSGYREFAESRLWDEYRKEMRRALDRSLLFQDRPEHELRLLREAIAEVEPQPRPYHLQRYLAEWLGDISARDLAVRFESWVANRLLADGSDGATTRRLTRLVDSRWRNLGRWFPPPTEIRIVTPLIPVFDREQDRIGFYRILLPRVGGQAPPDDLVPEAPLGLAFIRHLLERSDPAPALRERMQVDEIAYRYPSKDIRKRMIRGAKEQGLLREGLKWEKVPMVHLKLTGLDFTLLYDPAKRGRTRSIAPLCIDFGERDPDTPAGDPALMETVSALAPECSADL